MADGFLGFGASFMLDVVVCALVLVVPTLACSLYLVKVKRDYLWHRNLQLTLGIVLLAAVGAFEVDLQIVHDGWESIVQSREPKLEPARLETVRRVLWVHLVFAISTPLLWAVTIGLALKRMPSPPAPCPHSLWHRRLGWISTIDLVLTSITGLAFYAVAFVFR